MSVPEQSTEPADFFCVLLPTYGEFGSHAEVDYSVHPPKVHRCHCALDVYPRSRVFDIFPCIFVEKSLGDALIDAACSGFTLRDADLEPSDAFREFYREPKQIPRFIWCECYGKPGVDDFGLERGIRLIISKRVKNIVEAGPHEDITFVPGAKAPSDAEIKRILFEQADLTAKRLYEDRKRLRK